jgi:phage gp36-like protein
MYFTLSELQEYFGERGLPREFNDQDFDLVHSRTANQVESYLRSAGLEIPVVDPKALDILKGPAMDIACYHAWAGAAQPSENVKNRYTDAVSWLREVASGKVRIKTDEQESRKSGFHNVRIIRS